MSLEDAFLRCMECGSRHDMTADFIETAARKLGSRLPSVDLTGFIQALPHFKCSQCSAADPVLSAVVDGKRHEYQSSELARTCAACGLVIPPKRLAAVPDATLCVDCQGRIEKGEPVTREDLGTCRRCGADLVLRVTKRKAPIRYFLGCVRYPLCTYTQESPDSDEPASAPPAPPGPGPESSTSTTADGLSLFEALRAWRLGEARAQEIPAFCVLNNKTLHAIVEIRPRSLATLSAIRGFGPQKLRLYGEAVLDIVR